MAFFRKPRTPIAEAKSLIKKHKKRHTLPKGETIKVARLLREIKSSKLSEAEKLKIEAELLLILKAHEEAARDYHEFEQWAKFQNGGKMPKGFKKFRMELEWMMDRR